MILKEELPRSVGAQYATGNEWRNNSRKNEETEPKQKHHPVVDMTGDRSKVQLVPVEIHNLLLTNCFIQRAILHRNLECQVHESRQMGSDQTGDGKGERQHSRNQRTKMDWNG